MSKLACTLITLALGAAPAGTTMEQLELPRGRTLSYALVLPEDFDPEKTYPVLLALPPGAQDEAMVEAGLNRYWGAPAAHAGWIVVSPAAIGGRLFHMGGERDIPPLLDEIARRYHIEHGRFHLAGSSNGGRSAFRIATVHPDRFLSMTVLPGNTPTSVDFDALDQLVSMPVALFVGGEDREWLKPAHLLSSTLLRLGGEATLTVFPGEGHVPPSLDGGVVMMHLDEMRANVNAKMAKDEAPASQPAE